MQKGKSGFTDFLIRRLCPNKTQSSKQVQVIQQNSKYAKSSKQGPFIQQDSKYAKSSNLVQLIQYDSEYVTEVTPSTLSECKLF